MIALYIFSIIDNEEFEEMDLDESDELEFRRKTLQKMLIKKQQDWDSKSLHSEEQQKFFKNFEGIVVDPKGIMRSMIKMKIAEVIKTISTK